MFISDPNSRSGRSSSTSRCPPASGANASDWIVRPSDGRNAQAGDAEGEDFGRYPAAERRFLERILEFVQGAIDPGGATIDRETFADWLETRRRQLGTGELVYVAHQYDLLYRVPE